MNSFDSLVNKNLGWVHDNKYILPIMTLILGLYAALARPKLPKFVEKLFNNPVFRLIVISYIIYRGNKDPQLSIMIAAAFLITMHMINKKKVNNLICKIENMATPPQPPKVSAPPPPKAPAPPPPKTPPPPPPKAPAPPPPKTPPPPPPKAPAPKAPAPKAPAPKAPTGTVPKIAQTPPAAKTSR
jgi:outer membrane biosynthesis protein TonB